MSLEDMSVIISEYEGDGEIEGGRERPAMKKEETKRRALWVKRPCRSRLSSLRTTNVRAVCQSGALDITLTKRW